ncbi:MAG: PSP1 domain-containing protein, partial [Planctomycetota bacterium]
MPIVPLPQFEADVAELERERRVDALVEKGFSRDDLSGLTDDDLRRFERKKPPRSLVVRFGTMKLVGEYPYREDITPGCGTKLVVRTHRGTELGEMLTSTCPNAGCSKSVSRKEMLGYIENSGGRDYPFFTDGRVVRIATGEDLDSQARMEQAKNGLRAEARQIAADLGLDRAGAKVVEVEPVLGGERLTVYFTSEQRVDARELGRVMSVRHRTRVDVRHVGARDEARLVADYEKCGQYCCCKNFLKV